MSRLPDGPVYRKSRRGMPLREDDETPIYRPTPAMIADAHQRNAAPRTITQLVCGDPAHGQSALDKRKT